MLVPISSHRGVSAVKRALITGASRGIGAATARELAARGWQVVINYCRSKEKAEALARETGGTAICADVSDEAQVKAMFAEAGEVDALVCCAGTAHFGLLSDMSADEWRRIFAVNTDGVFYCCREAIPHMVRQKSGSIVIVSSMWGQTGGSCEAAYSASKGAVIALTKALAKELGPSNVRVNCIAPGVIDTDMNAHLSASDMAALRDETPLGRIGLPEETAKAAAFLVSEEAGFITGQVLGVNGGLVI